jgi:hypothetical protein
MPHAFDGGLHRGRRRSTPQTSLSLAACAITTERVAHRSTSGMFIYRPYATSRRRSESAPADGLVAPVHAWTAPQAILPRGAARG